MRMIEPSGEGKRPKPAWTRRAVQSARSGGLRVISRTAAHEVLHSKQNFRFLTAGGNGSKAPMMKQSERRVGSRCRLPIDQKKENFPSRKLHKVGEANQGGEPSFEKKSDIVDLADQAKKRVRRQSCGGKTDKSLMLAC